MSAGPSNIIVHRPNIIVQEFNSVPALDEAGTELNSQMENISGLGRKYYRPGRGRDGARFPERKYFRPWTEIFPALDEAGTELSWPWTESIPALDGINSGLGRN